MEDKEGSSPYTRGLRNVFTDGKYSDLTLICQGRTWNVHKLVLCTQSAFFAKACDGAFKEAHQNSITLTEDEPEVLEVLLHYLYHFDYSDDTSEGLPPLLLNIQLLAVADKYFVEPLQNLATEKFNQRAYEDWHKNSFAEALVTIFATESTSVNFDTLRLIMLEVVQKHAYKLFNEVGYGSFERATLSAPRFLLAYTKSVTVERPAELSVSKTSNLNWYKCPGAICKKYGVVFGVHNTVPSKFRFKCPLNCISGKASALIDQSLRDQKYWNGHRTMVEVSDKDVQLDYGTSAS